MFYVDEIDGSINRDKFGTHPMRAFSGFEEASKYSSMIRARNNNEKKINDQLKSLQTQKSSSSSATAPVSGVAGLFILILLPFKLISLIFKLFSNMWKWIFSKGTNFIKRIIGIIFFGVVAFGLFSFGKNVYTKKFQMSGYVTTKIQVLEYATKEENPSGKEIGKIASDSVLKNIKVSKTNNVTWLKVYKLENKNPLVTWILLPDVVNIKEDNKYLVYNENSKTWNNYYSYIDEQNAKLLKEHQKAFEESIKNIKINHSSDKILKESLNKDGFIFPKKGYLELYKSNDNDFYYISKEFKSEFLQIAKKAEKQYKKEKIKYFNK